jgi:hypothetical protein
MREWVQTGQLWRLMEDAKEIAFVHSSSYGWRAKIPGISMGGFRSAEEAMASVDKELAKHK